MSAVAKKQRLGVEWRLVFNQTQSLRTLIDVVGNILTRINLRLTKENDEFFLCIDSIDPQHVCMVQARLVCEHATMTQPDSVTFCVDSSQFNTCLKSVPSHYSLEMYRKEGSADIHMCAYETLSNSHVLRFEVPTLLDESETMQLHDMAYKYTIEMDLGTLRSIIKMSISLRAQHVDFKVLHPQPDHVDSEDILHTVFSVSANGDCKQEHDFFSATVREEGDSECIIRAAMDSSTPVNKLETSNMICSYCDAFATNYLNLFLKSMERQIITMKMSKDQPLVLNYPLGAENSYIKFVLAPKTDDN